MLNNIFIAILSGIFLIVIKGVFESPIYCDTGDDDDSASNNQTNPTAGNEPSVPTEQGAAQPPSTSAQNTYTTNKTETESLNSRLGKDVSAIAVETGKVVSIAAQKAMEKVGADVTMAVGNSVSQAIGQAGLAAAIVGGMGAGVSMSSGQTLPVRMATSAALGVVSGGTHVVFSNLNRSLADSQASRKTGSDSTPPSPGLEPSDYPFHSVNESINLEPLVDNPVQE